MGGFLNDETVLDQIRPTDASTYFITTPFPVGKLLGSERFGREYIWDRREPYPFRSFELAGYLDSNFVDAVFINLKEVSSSEDRDLSLEDAQRYMIERAQYFLENEIHLPAVKTSMEKVGIRSGGDSVLYYTFIMDSFNHNYGALNERTMERAAAIYADIVAMIRVLKETGLDEEYALFVSSDHGGQFFLDEDELCNHGCHMDGGNEAILYVYSKGEGQRLNDVWMNTEDVGATIPQYIEKAGVPGTATGTVFPMFTDSNPHTDKYVYQAFRSKEIQLISHLNYLQPKQLRDVQLVQGVDISNVDLGDATVLTQYIADYPDYLAALQDEVESLQKPWLAYFALALLIAAFLYFVVGPLLLGMGLSSRDWVCVGLLFAEMVTVAVRNQGLGRVEKMIWWPLVFIQVGFMAAGFLYASDSTSQGEKGKRLAHVLRLLNVPSILWRAAVTRSRGPLSQLSVSDVTAMIISLNVVMMLTDELGNVFTRIGEALYYVHYAVITLYILYDSQTQGKEAHRTLWALARYFSVVLLVLAWVYEFVTDYSMSDQTEEMMTVIHVFYVAILALLLTIPTIVPKSERGRLIIYPVYIIYFFIASQQQRSHLLFVFIPTMEVLSRMARTQDSFYLYSLMATQGSSTYLINRGSYGFDISLRAGNHSWGTYPDEFPIFTGAIFAFHKMSWYHMVGAYLYRSLQYPLSMKGSKFAQLIVCRGLVVLMVFMIGFYANPANTLSVFMWAMAQCSIMLFSHTILIFSGS